jgi:hypothetical protein
MNDAELRQKAIEAGWRAYRRAGTSFADAIVEAVETVLVVLPTKASRLTGEERARISLLRSVIKGKDFAIHADDEAAVVALFDELLAKRRTIAPVPAEDRFTWEQVQAAFNYASRYVILPDLAMAKFRQEMKAKLLGSGPDERAALLAKMLAGFNLESRPPDYGKQAEQILAALDGRGEQS